MLRLIPLVMCACLCSGVALADEAEPKEKATAERATHIVAHEELAIAVRAEARLEAGRSAKLRLIPEAYSGSFDIVYIERDRGFVTAGQTILRFDDESLREQIRSAEHTLNDQQQRLAFEQEELAIMREANATRLERAEKALADAQQALMLWKTYSGPRMLRTADLGTRSRESGVLNQREELAQLEAMYEGAELESQTREIVLERARRSLAIAEEWLDITQEDERVTTDYTHPQRTRDVNDEVRYREEALEHAQVQTRIGEARKEQTIAQLERSIDESETRLARLNNDLEQLVVAAPIDGILTRITHEPGDRINARQVIAEVHDPSSFRLTFNASPNDLRVLDEGQVVTIRLPEMPEVVMQGRVEAIEPIGKAASKTTSFGVEVIISEPHPLARLGMNAQVEMNASLGEVVALPRNAVTWEHGLAYVDVPGDDEPARTAVVLAASNDDKYQVVNGVGVGDVVLLPEKD